MSFYENNKEWLEGWEYKIPISYSFREEYCNGDFLVVVVNGEYFYTSIRKSCTLLLQKLAFHLNRGRRQLLLPDHFTNWKQPTDNEQDMFEMLYGVRLPWKEFIL